MSQSTSKDFGLKFRNIPIINLRIDFREVVKYAQDMMLEDAEFPSTKHPHWYNKKEEIEGELNWIICRSIMGIEAYVKYAVSKTLHNRGIWSHEKSEVLKNPFSKKRKLYEAYFDVLPSLIAEDMSLKISQPVLWQNTVALYMQVRNPLFHGMEVYDIEPSQFMMVIKHLEKLYAWMDGWCLPK